MLAPLEWFHFCDEFRLHSFASSVAVLNFMNSNWADDSFLIPPLGFTWEVAERRSKGILPPVGAGGRGRVSKAETTGREAEDLMEGCGRCWVGGLIRVLPSGNPHMLSAGCLLGRAAIGSYWGPTYGWIQ